MIADRAEQVVQLVALALGMVSRVGTDETDDEPAVHGDTPLIRPMACPDDIKLHAAPR